MKRGPKPKLTDEQVREIRNSGLSNKEEAFNRGLSVSTVWRARRLVQITRERIEYPFKSLAQLESLLEELRNK